ncbi:RNA-binding cell elongation regulator Jag/EloR [uncultured Eubacterium sp.]|uniref:RNA-binding cell elongation regulator Jag/EloR n=1 Tax=uncultured Eubacterium sp. TaxID=165185 RepID=UPI0026394758|nr:RNA-binding cell elongation regulator Jag/EloR [uncultured Eubacterium sp.]
MIIERIGSGKTLEDAVAAAKALLNAPVGADIKTEVLQTGSKGFLGFGKKDFEVKVSFDDGKRPEKAKKPTPEKKPAQQKPAQKKQVAPKKPQAPKKQEAPAKPAQAQEAKSDQPKKEYPKSVDLEYAKSYFLTILEGLKIVDPKIEASYAEGVVTIDLDCEDYGIVIGHRGETLDSIQYLLSLVIKKSTMEYVRVVINVGNYREKRALTLSNLAKKNAQRVLRTGRRYTFEPMNPYERRIIHTAVQEIEGVESRSIGYNQDRRVVLEPTGGAKRNGGNGGNYRRGGRNQAVTKAPENHTPKADRADLPKFGKIEVNK